MQITANSQPGQTLPLDYFKNVDASLKGGSHFSLDGTFADGERTKRNWDGIGSHSDLLDATLLSEDYQVATKGTQPNARGIPCMQQASVTIRNGNTEISLDAKGNALVTQLGYNDLCFKDAGSPQFQRDPELQLKSGTDFDAPSMLPQGHSLRIHNGQAFQLGYGESVQREQDGSLVIEQRDADDAHITTTLRSHNDGVDVSVHAENLAIGGYLPSGRGRNAPPLHGPLR